MSLGGNETAMKQGHMFIGGADTLIIVLQGCVRSSQLSKNAPALEASRTSLK